MSITLTRKQALAIREALEELHEHRAEDVAFESHTPNSWQLHFREDQLRELEQLLGVLPEPTASDRAARRLETDQLRLY